jgi:pSer/pThr/pTyr-binding forkhead associated (FHA) protein
MDSGLKLLTKMPNLILRFKGNVLEEHPVKVGETITIGRKDSNNIVIDNLAVSGMHARVDSVSATFILTDLESTNGTFVNGELVSSHTLRDNDVILIGKHELVFDRSDLTRKQHGPDNLREDEQTRFLNTAEYRDLINKATGSGGPVRRNSNIPESFEQEEKKGFFSRIWKTLFG